MKKLTVFIVTVLVCPILHSQFAVSYNSVTGAIRSITNDDDKNKMNWIFSSTDSIPTWQQTEQDWGIGKYTVQSQQQAWKTPSGISIKGNTSNISYSTQHLGIQVSREIAGGFFTETYTFRNITNNSIQVDSLGIYTPFNDNYPDATTCATNRCNAHIWPGLNSSYVNAIRMGGTPSHLGLVFTKGAMESYSIENRGLDGGAGYKASNVRGTVVLNMPSFTLTPNATYTVQWKIFWHKRWDDFYATAKKLGFVKLDANCYVVEQNGQLSVTADSKSFPKIKTVNADTKTLGEHTLQVPYGDHQSTLLNYLVISSPDKIIDKRVHFIVEHQQMNDTADGRYGAYMVYNNETGTILIKPEKSDRDEGRERLGMGVMIAKWLQKHADPAVQKSLLRYVFFVRNKLQTPDYKLFSDTAHKSKNRGYNYPWAADLYLQAYHLTKDLNYLRDFYYTMQRFYKDFGYQFYAIGIPVKDGLGTLKNASLKMEYDSLLVNYKLMADHFIKNGINYPKSEVNYEQSIVAPAVLFLLELYTVTKETKYLEEAKHQMPSLDAFQGHQPDVHLNEIGIRHWDGYWFGKRAMWGDVMPHHWSTLTGVAFQQYFELTNDSTYRNRAVRNVQNNLLNFKEDGSASCAYIYPKTVNGIAAKFYDPYANDQDWALYYYLKINSTP